MRTDNQEHKALFAIPSPSHSTEIAITKPLPPQRVITGHKQTDAYLWVLEVIKLNEPAHLPAAEEALKKLKVTPKQAQDRYQKYLLDSGAHPLQIAFGTVSMGNPAASIRRARENIEKARQVRAIFGEHSAALEDVEPEKIIKSSPNYVSDYHWGWTDKERKAKSIGHSRLIEIDDARRALVNGYRDVLPEPYTLSDVVREFQYWDWLYQMRDCAAREEGWEYGYSQHPEAIYDRENYLEELMATIKPISRNEALEVCKWVLANESLNDLGEKTDNIILNLVGECG
ncbi:helix-turn-helix domain-containing protein [Pectobacterium parmentieri]|uniref:helix-turn-helix domain-containing protein n=1 Tax=Pectobacterium parmentieri TaxID=1905730 RepID=UPI000EAEBACE|nr:helix-turn-helix domain-containing protein [Pectobacterium parmentieri]AYH32985.1 helix-turn-helix domain containing protein [Pectobacterium parmentieri]